MKGSKRLFLILTLLVVAGALVSLVWTSFTGSLVYFYTPTEIQAQSTTMVGQKVRIGGMVQEGSLQKEPGTLKMRFQVTDGSNKLMVAYEGITPDLFREGQGVIVEGVWRSGEDFLATSLLAKHSEDYIPIQMTKDGIAKAKESILETLR